MNSQNYKAHTIDATNTTTRCTGDLSGDGRKCEQEKMKQKKYIGSVTEQEQFHIIFLLNFSIMRCIFLLHFH